jgi:hypothetical protein
MKHKYGTYFFLSKIFRLQIKLLNFLIKLKTSTQEHFKTLKVI